MEINGEEGDVVTWHKGRQRFKRERWKAIENSSLNILRINECLLSNPTSNSTQSNLSYTYLDIMADNSNNQQPGLIGGHAQYVKGAAEVSFSHHSE